MRHLALIVLALTIAGQVAANQLLLSKPSVRAKKSGTFHEYVVTAPRRIRRDLTITVRVNIESNTIVSARVTTEKYSFDLSQDILHLMPQPRPQDIALGSDAGVFGEEYWWVIPYGEEQKCYPGHFPSKARYSVDIHVDGDGRLIEAINGGGCR